MLFIKTKNQNGTERKAHFLDLGDLGGSELEPDAVEPWELELDRERRDLLP